MSALILAGFGFKGRWWLGGGGGGLWEWSALMNVFIRLSDALLRVKRKIDKGPGTRHGQRKVVISK